MHVYHKNRAIKHKEALQEKTLENATIKAKFYLNSENCE